MRKFFPRYNLLIAENAVNQHTLSNEKVRELCGFSRRQARYTLDKMRKEENIEIVGAGRSSKYVLK